MAKEMAAKKASAMGSRFTSTLCALADRETLAPQHVGVILSPRTTRVNYLHIALENGLGSRYPGIEFLWNIHLETSSDQNNHAFLDDLWRRERA